MPADGRHRALNGARQVPSSSIVQTMRHADWRHCGNVPWRCDSSVSRGDRVYGKCGVRPWRRCKSLRYLLQVENGFNHPTGTSGMAVRPFCLLSNIFDRPCDVGFQAMAASDYQSFSSSNRRRKEHLSTLLHRNVYGRCSSRWDFGLLVVDSPPNVFL